MPQFSLEDLAFVAGYIVVMFVVIFLFRRVLNVVVIDVCILGNCSAWKNICACCYGGSDDANRPEGWRVRDVRVLTLLGAFSNPAAYLYSPEVSDSTRQKFLEIIDSELLEQKQIDEEGGIENSPPKQSLDDVDGNGEVQKEPAPTSSAANESQQSAPIQQPDEIDVESDNICSICLQELDNGDDTCTVRVCSHAFHSTCIKQWIARSLSCPVCRKQMIGNDKLLDYISANRQLFSDAD